MIRQIKGKPADPRDLRIIERMIRSGRRTYQITRGKCYQITRISDQGYHVLILWFDRDPQKGRIERKMNIVVNDKEYPDLKRRFNRPKL